LSHSQSKIYLTLISLGTADVKKIAETTMIDRGEVYRQLEILQKKSLINKIVDIPTEFKPMPFKMAIKTLVQQKNEENAQIHQIAKALLKKKFQRQISQEEKLKIKIIPKNEYRKIVSLGEISNSKNEVLCYSQIARISRSQGAYNEAIKKAAKRGVRFRFILELDELSDQTVTFLQEYMTEISDVEVRFTNTTTSASFTIFDGKEMNFSTEKITGVANSQMLVTNDLPLINVIKVFFEFTWNSAMREYPKKDIPKLRFQKTS
jgi:sugar-specific transcriptional regulator TrmB